MNFTAPRDLADVAAVSENVVEWSDHEPGNSRRTGLRDGSSPGRDTPLREIVGQQSDGTHYQIALENRPHHRGFLGHDDQLFVGDPVANRDRSADPDALSFRGVNLVAHPFADHLAFELRER